MDTEYHIFGASGHAKVVLDILLTNGISITSIVDDNPTVPNLLNIPIIYSKDFILKETDEFIIAIGENSIRKTIVEKYNFQFYKAIHPDATVSQFASIAEGTVVMPQAVINAAATIGKHCIINSRSIVEHDCVLEDYVHISPNASLAGNVTIGKGSQIGIGASVIQGVKIGKWVTIGAGAVVTQDIPDNCTAVGIPAKPIKFH
jgi:acetyltransferase EpsM